MTTANPGEVLLEEDGTTLAIDQVVFRRVYAKVFGSEPIPWGLTAEAVGWLATAAQKLGETDLGERLRLFAAATKYVAIVRLGESRVTDLPTPMSGNPRKLGTVKMPAGNPVPDEAGIRETAAANEARAATAADVAAFFAEEDE